MRLRYSPALRKPRCYLSEEEIKIIIDNAYEFSPFLGPLLRVFAHTGARRKELLDLKWSEVNFQTDTLLFRKTKNGRDRIIKIPHQIRKMFEELPRVSSHVFTNRKGLPISAAQIFDEVRYFKRKYPMNKDWTIKSLRNSYAHNFLKSGKKMYALQAILGHRDIALTVNLYGQLKAVEVEDPSPYKF